MTITVSNLYIYPVKSCGRLVHDAAALGARGLVNDRRWMVVSDEPGERGMFLTQRELPELARVQPSFEGDCLVLRAPGMLDIGISLEGATGRRGRVTVWNDTCEATDEGDEISVWLSNYLRYPARLARLADDFQRPVSMQYTNEPAEVGFADGYPLLLISEASLDDLNARLAARGKTTIPMSRFRPNLVVSGCDAFAEDTWAKIRVGSVVFDLVKPCARCVTTTVDQTTGSIPDTAEPLATLATFRRGANGVLFGQNIIHRGLGTLRVGDEIEIVTPKN